MTRSTAGAFAGARLLFDDGVWKRLRLCWRLLRDDRVTVAKFALPALLALYVASPIDTIPDILLGIGQIDDVGAVVAIVLLLARIMPRLAPTHVVEEHLQSMAGAANATAPAAGEWHVVDADFSIRDETFVGRRQERH